MRELVDRLINALNQQNWQQLNCCLAENLIRHSSASPEQRTEDRQAFIDFVKEIRQAFPDLYYDIQMTISEDEMVACYLRLKGTQKKDLGSLAASGRQIDMPFVAFFRIQDGQIAEIWLEWDNVFFLKQLGHFHSN